VRFVPESVSVQYIWHSPYYICSKLYRDCERWRLLIARLRKYIRVGSLDDDVVEMQGNGVWRSKRYSKSSNAWRACKTCRQHGVIATDHRTGNMCPFIVTVKIPAQEQAPKASSEIGADDQDQDQLAAQPNATELN